MTGSMQSGSAVLRREIDTSDTCSEDHKMQVRHCRENLPVLAGCRRCRLDCPPQAFQGRTRPHASLSQ